MQTLHLPPTLTLDYETWRCGQYAKCEEHRHGRGQTQLLNKSGFMCCLGQFSIQAGAKPNDLLGIANPSVVYERSRVKEFLQRESDSNKTEFALKAMGINDDSETGPWLTIPEKAAALRKLFAARGHTIELVNFPPDMMEEIARLEAAA